MKPGFTDTTQKPNSRVLFPGRLKFTGTIAEYPTCDSKISVPMVLSAVAEMVDPSHKHGRGQLRT
jgi:hypothetical protein